MDRIPVIAKTGCAGWRVTRLGWKITFLCSVTRISNFRPIKVGVMSRHTIYNRLQTIDLTWNRYCFVTYISITTQEQILINSGFSIAFRQRWQTIKNPVKPWFYGICLSFSTICLWCSAERKGSEPFPLYPVIINSLGVWMFALVTL